MATILQMTEALIAAHNAGDEKAARVLAAAIKERKAKLPQEKPMDPTEGMSAGGKLLAGFGKAFVDFGRAFDSQQEVDEARKLDAPLMESGWAKGGNIAGNIAAIAPAALIPGANTVAGSAALGAVTGALQPVGSGDSRLGNTLTGAAFGAAVPTAMLAGRTAKAMAIDPFRKGGQEAIAGRMIGQFAQDPSKVAAAAGKSSILGTKPTLAELAGDDGISQLQRTIMTQNPQTAARLSSRAEANNAARIRALEDMAGDDGQRALFSQMRETTAKDLYGKAWKAGFNEKRVAAIKPQIESLLSRPSIVRAQAVAKRIAAEEGEELTDTGSMKGLHYIKKALDGFMDDPRLVGAERAAVEKTRQELVGVMQHVSKGGKYGKAMAEYEALSKPLNQMDVGKRLLDTTTSAMKDFSGNPRLHGEAFANALRKEATTVSRATGFKGAKTLESVMSPSQMAKLRAIESELSAVAAAREGGKVSGSPTAQYLVGQDILRRSAGPLGLPKSWLEGQLAQNFGARPLTFAYKVPEERIMGLLGDAMLDPQIAASLLAKANKPGPVQQFLMSNPKAKGMLELSVATAQVSPLAVLPSQR